MKCDTSVTQTGSRERGRSALRRITVIKPPGKNCIAGFKSVCRVRGTIPGLKDEKHLRNRIKNPQRCKSCLCVNMLLLSFHSMNICQERDPHHGVSDSSSSSGDVGEVGVSSPSAAAVAAGDAAAAAVGVIFS